MRASRRRRCSSARWRKWSGGTIAQPRAVSLLVAAFAVLALMLAAVGVYGVMAYSVRERTQEIGIRMALGASNGQVFQLVIGQALRLVVLRRRRWLGRRRHVDASAQTQVLQRLLFEVEPLDAWTFGGDSRAAARGRGARVLSAGTARDAPGAGGRVENVKLHR